MGLFSSTGKAKEGGDKTAAAPTTTPKAEAPPSGAAPPRHKPELRGKGIGEQEAMLKPPEGAAPVGGGGKGPAQVDWAGGDKQFGPGGDASGEAHEDKKTGKADKREEGVSSYPVDRMLGQLTAGVRAWRSSLQVRAEVIGGRIAGATLHGADPAAFVTCFRGHGRDFREAQLFERLPRHLTEELHLWMQAAGHIEGLDGHLAFPQFASWSGPGASAPPQAGTPVAIVGKSPGLLNAYVLDAAMQVGYSGQTARAIGHALVHAVCAGLRSSFTPMAHGSCSTYPVPGPVIGRLLPAFLT